jgi:hypothetical protein
MQPVQPAGRQRLHGKSARWTTLPELTRRAARLGAFAACMPAIDCLDIQIALFTPSTTGTAAR